jgi:hypothetical protein
MLSPQAPEKRGGEGPMTETQKYVVNVNIYKLLMERYPDAHPDKPFAELVDATELAEITRKAEAMAETSLKFVTEASSSLLSSPDSGRGGRRQFHHRDGRKPLHRLPTRKTG